MRILVNGYKGKMGILSCKAISQDPDLNLVGKSDIKDNLIKKIEETNPQVIIDFTSPSIVMKNIKIMISYGINPVIGTSGLSYRDINLLTKLCKTKKLGCLIIPNFSIANNLMIKFSKHSYKYFKKLAILDMHHDKKIDNPSGTSLKIMNSIKSSSYLKKNISVHPIRLPGFLSHHEIIFGGISETFIIKANSINRNAFIPGICFSCKIVNKLNGLIYGLDNLL